MRPVRGKGAAKYKIFMPGKGAHFLAGFLAIVGANLVFAKTFGKIGIAAFTSMGVYPGQTYVIIM